MLRKTADRLPGIGFAKESSMSPITRALHQRFEEVCLAELQRLRRKTAALTPEERAEVDAISVELTRAMAARFGAVLERHPAGDLHEIVARLFAVAEPGNLDARDAHFELG